MARLIKETYVPREDKPPPGRLEKAHKHLQVRLTWNRSETLVQHLGAWFEDEVENIVPRGRYTIPGRTPTLHTLLPLNSTPSDYHGSIL